VRLGEREIPGERPGCADTDVGDVRFDASERGQHASDDVAALDAPVCGGGADAQRVLRRADVGEGLDRLHVDEVRPAGDAQLHREEDLGAAGVHSGVLAEEAAQLHGLLDRGRSMNVEASQHRWTVAS
jgi:hypothetical protein